MNQKNKKFGFTIIELLTVTAIIAMLVGVLLPALNSVRNTAKKVKQKAQITVIDNVLMIWRNDEGDYPPSDCIGPYYNYCGAQKLAEALLGRDLLGFNPNVTPASWANGNDRTFYPKMKEELENSLRMRRKPYIEIGTNPAFRIGDDSTGLGGPGLFKHTGNLSPDTYVICDVFGVRRMKIGQTKMVTAAGSPILYYRANTSSKTMELTVPLRDRIYNSYDNLPILTLNKLKSDGSTGNKHRLYGGLTIPYDGSGDYFYSDNYKIVNQKIKLAAGGKLWPHRPDSYILISAGLDGEYGTPDDICNF